MHSIFIMNGFGIWNATLWAGLVADLWQEVVLYFIIFFWVLLTGPGSCELGALPLSQHAPERATVSQRGNLIPVPCTRMAILTPIGFTSHCLVLDYRHTRKDSNNLPCHYLFIHEHWKHCCAGHYLLSWNDSLWLFSSVCYDDWWRQVAVLYRWQHIKVASL